MVKPFWDSDVPVVTILSVFPLVMAIEVTGVADDEDKGRTDRATTVIIHGQSDGVGARDDITVRDYDPNPDLSIPKVPLPGDDLSVGVIGALRIELDSERGIASGRQGSELRHW
jgi:hypothetical protein